MTSCMVSTVYCHSLNSKLFVSWAKKHKKKLHFRFSVVHSRRDVIFVSPFLTPLTFQSKFLLLYPVLSGLFQTHVLKHYIIIIFLLFFSSCFKYFSLSLSQSQGDLLCISQAIFCCSKTQKKKKKNSKTYLFKVWRFHRKMTERTDGRSVSLIEQNKPAPKCSSLPV